MRRLVHYHPRIGETVDIRITPPVLRSNRPVHTAAADFSTQRSLPPHLTNPIFTPVHVQRTGLSTQEPSLTPPQPTPCTEYSVYSSHSLLLGPPTQLRTARQWSLSSTEHAAYSSHSFCTQHTAVILVLRSIQQSLFFYAAYSSHFYAAYSSHSFSTQQSLVPPLPPLLSSGHHLCCLKEGTGSAHACLRTAEILAFRPLRGTPSSRHVPLYDRNAFHRGCKVGVVISSDSCWGCLLYTSPSPRDLSTSRMPSSA